MSSRVEFISRAALCRQLAELEPANRLIWMVEAEYWSRQSENADFGKAGPPVRPGALAAFRARVARSLSNPASAKIA
jgi:hypothetical protein